MKIQIVGVGVVGEAQAYLATNLGHKVLGVDPKKTGSAYARMSKTYEPDVDITWVCPPEAFVPGVVDDLVKNKVKGLYVIKSTVPPGTTAGLMQKHTIHISHNPEFLKENMSFDDIMHPSMVVIGECCEPHRRLLEEFYAPLKVPIIVTRPTVSETVKVSLNSYLATLISFWNEIDLMAKALNISTAEVADIAKHNPRVSAYGTAFFGSPFGGKCLPKDLNQTIETCRRLGVNAQMLEAIRDFNGTIK